MKRLVLALSLVLAGTLASAASVDCSVSGLTARQQVLLDAFLADVNEARVDAGQQPYADFAAYCSATTFSVVASYIARQATVEANKLAEAAQTNGDDTAPNGCKKRGEVACFVLTGNTTCG